MTVASLVVELTKAARNHGDFEVLIPDMGQGTNVTIGNIEVWHDLKTVLLNPEQLERKLSDTGVDLGKVEEIPPHDDFLCRGCERCDPR